MTRLNFLSLTKHLFSTKLILCLLLAGLVLVLSFDTTLPLLYDCILVALFIFISSYFEVAEKPNLKEKLQFSTPNILTKSSSESTRYNASDLPIAILKISDNGRVYAANRAAKKLLSIPENESLLFSDLVEGMGRSVALWVESAKRRKSSKVEFAMAKRAARDVYLQVQIVVQGKGDNAETLAVVTDATELKSMEAQFVQSQKMQAIGQLAGGVAHDFNNLLTAISGYCDLLMLRHEMGDSDYADLQQIRSNSNRAAALVGQLLAYSRKQTLKPSSIQVNDTLSELTHLLNRLVGEKIHLQLDQGKNLPLAFVDGRQLEQVIMNLVINARDAMPDGGNITIRAFESIFEKDQYVSRVPVSEGRYVIITVQDTGIGIDKEKQAKIFEPFYSTKEVGKGTGLGLSMAYGILKQTGGYIFVDSEENKGCTFSIYLPVSEQKETAKVVQEPSTKTVGVGLAAKKVLLVEDEDAVRAFSSRALERQGIVVTEASSGEHAINQLKNACGDFDLVITDVVMPEMDGPTWVKKAQTELEMKAKVIFVSGYAEESFAEKWDEINDAAFLPKPYSLTKLISTVSDMVEN